LVSCIYTCKLSNICIVMVFSFSYLVLHIFEFEKMKILIKIICRADKPQIFMCIHLVREDIEGNIFTENNCTNVVPHELDLGRRYNTFKLLQFPLEDTNSIDFDHLPFYGYLFPGYHKVYYS